MTGQPNIDQELALLALLSVLWGASYTFIRIDVATIPPLTLITARTLIAGLLLVGVIRARGIAWPHEAATWGKFLAQACLNSVIPFTLIAWAEQAVDAGLATILNSTSPIFAFLLTALVTRQGRPRCANSWASPRGWSASASWSVLKRCTGSAPRSGLSSPSSPPPSAMRAAIYGKSFRGLDPMLPAAGSLLAGTVLLLPAALVIERP